jgi:hypothetical protein
MNRYYLHKTVTITYTRYVVANSLKEAQSKADDLGLEHCQDSAHETNWIQHDIERNLKPALE